MRQYIRMGVTSLKLKMEVNIKRQEEQQPRI